MSIGPEDVETSTPSGDHAGPPVQSKDLVKDKHGTMKTELKVDGMQIIGFINQVVPFSPAVSREAAPVTG